MDEVTYGSLKELGIEIVRRNSEFYVRYDVGSHMVRLREDKITSDEAKAISEGGKSQESAMNQLQKRLLAAGIDAYSSNWALPSV